MVETLYENNEHKIREILIGKTVKKISDKELELSDGTVLELAGNIGGCSCGAGDYELTYLNECPDNAIMDVKVINLQARHEPYDDGPQIYSIFVLAADSKLMELARFEGDDGNGYYGTGFNILIK